MTAYFVTRARYGWSERFSREMSPEDVKALREAKRERYAGVDLSLPGALYKATKVGETVLVKTAGTLTELAESGAEI